MSDRPFLTREQRYAKAVFNKIEPFIKRPESDRKKYGSLAHKLPVLIRTAGLAQALAFVQARNDEQTPQRQLLRDLADVLRENGALAKDADLVAQSRLAAFDEYMRLTEAALQALLWFKRFAQSELKVQAGEE
ncbi:type III-B CRISPR module-associated protein Cmr5 [Chloroflexus sp.]|uniref:type III-B CRISPR module-associated protein Cmr5 n=1 Tax=Chloroflexus sp. TaxID=1904827 RepID=UPI002ACD7D29|nr:type III-B CRISPR module-associated protein Cmr5 [Chloroflexus sp.]